MKTTFQFLEFSLSLSFIFSFTFLLTKQSLILFTGSASIGTKIWFIYERVPKDEKHIPEFIYSIYIRKLFRNNIKRQISLLLKMLAFGAAAIVLWKTCTTYNKWSSCTELMHPIFCHSILHLFFLKWKSSETFM